MRQEELPYQDLSPTEPYISYILVRKNYFVNETYVRHARGKRSNGSQGISLTARGAVKQREDTFCGIRQEPSCC